MLRGLRRPHRLETEPLARFLCHAYGIERPYDACVRLIGDALLDKGLVGKRLYELIQVCDLDANDTLVGTASAMGISPRQFFRYRREAIVALAKHANALGAAHPPPTSPVEELARLLSELDPAAGARVYEIAHASAASRLQRFEAALNAGTFPDDATLAELHGSDRIHAMLKTANTAYVYGSTRAGDALVDASRAQIDHTIVKGRETLEYEFAHTRYLRALYRENVPRCTLIARELVLAARGDEMRTIAALAMEAESDLRSGDLVLAEQAITAAEDLIMPRKQLRLLSILLCLRSAVAFMKGELETAYAYVQSVQLALPDRPIDAMTLNAFKGRVSLAKGLAWRAPRELLEIVEPPVRILTTPRGGAVALDGSTRRLFQRLYLKSVDLRAAMVAGEFDTLDDSVEVLTLARQAGYRGIECSVLATLAQWSSRNGMRDDAQRHGVAAWRTVVEFGDAFVAYDLFWPGDAREHEFGAIDLDDAFLGAFCESLSTRFPAIALVNAPAGAEKHAFWRATLLDARGTSGKREADHTFLTMLANSPARDGFAKQRAPFVRAVARDASLLLPAGERASFASAVSRTLEAALERLPGGRARTKRPQF
jgi:hypothetical protein